MAPMTTSEPVRTNRGGRPRDPSRDGVIREAILRLLGTVGYGALTMDAVAAEAGVGKATIYRRWRTKEDLVVDTVMELTQFVATPVDTGSLDGDIRTVMHRMVEMINAESGTALRALLPSMQHQPAFFQAFTDGPLTAWRDSYREMWDRAEARGEVPGGMAGSVAADTIGALLVQRWLLTGLPVTVEYADEVFETVVRPVIASVRP